MWLPFEILEENLFFSVEWIILLVVLVGGFIFYAKDFKLGVLLHFFAFSVCTMWFKLLDWNDTPALILMMMFLVIMSLTFYSIKETSLTRGFV